MMAIGIVTLTFAGHMDAKLWNRSHGRSHLTPLAEGFSSKLVERATGNQMALDIEEVVDGGVDREKALR